MTFQTYQPFIRIINPSRRNIGISDGHPKLQILEIIIHEFPTITIHKLELYQLQIIPTSQFLIWFQINWNTTINITHRSCTDIGHKHSCISRGPFAIFAWASTMGNFDQFWVLFGWACYDLVLTFYCQAGL